ncbi:MAG: hypothetical protein ACRC4N_15430, partial [Gammaproteobacteria bacterium]
SVSLSTVSVCLSVYSIRLSVCLQYLSVSLSTVSVCLSVYSIRLSLCLQYLSVSLLKQKALLLEKLAMTDA